MSSWLPLGLSIVAGLGTSVGGLLLFLIPLSKLSLLYGQLEAASAGIMLFLSFRLLFEEGLPALGWSSLLFCGLGFALMAGLQTLLHSIIPSETESLEEGNPKKPQVSIAKVGTISFITMAAHNFPEGISVALTTMSNTRLGILLCLAILLHNILEGMVVGLPILYTTRSVSSVFIYTLVNGLAEPAGVIFVWILFGLFGFPLDEWDSLVSQILAMVSGVMIGLSFLELIPHALEWHRLKSGSWFDIFVALCLGFIGGAVVVTISDKVLLSVLY